MATGNITYEQGIGLMTAMTEITRNGAKSARGLVSIQSRYNQILDDSSTTGKKLSAWYKEHNIELKDQNGQLKSFFEVGGEVADKWDEMSENEKKYYLNIQAGANQSQNLAALMRNYKTALEATATAEKEENSAAKENARYMDSLAGKLANLKSAWENFSRTMVNSDMIKDGIEALTKALDFLASDAGQSMIKVARDVGVMYLAFRSFGKLFAGGKAVAGLLGFGKSTKIVTKALKGGGKHIDDSAKAFGRLGKAAGGAAPAMTETGTVAQSLMKLFAAGGAGWGLLGAAGVVAGLIALNEHLDPDNKYAQTTDALQQVKEKLKEVNAEIQQLERKREESGLSKSEQTRLDLLNKQKESLEEQVKLYDELKKKQYTEKEKKPDKKSDGQNRGVKSVTKGAGGRGTTDQDIVATDKLTSKLKEYNDVANRAGQIKRDLSKAQQELNIAQKSGDLEGQARAQEKITQLLESYSETTNELPDKMEATKQKLNEWVEAYGSVNDIQDEGMRKSAIEIQQVVKGYDDLKSKLSGISSTKGLKEQLGARDYQKVTQDLLSMGKAIGIVKDESGNVNNINFDKFSATMEEAGMSADQTKEALLTIAKTNPEATVTIEGTEVANENVETVLDFLDKLNGDDAEATVNIDGTEVAVQDIGDLQTLLDILNGKKSVSDVSVSGTEESKQKADEFDATVRKLPLQHNTKIKTSGAPQSEQQAEGVKKKLRTIPLKTNPKITVKPSGVGIIDTIKQKLANLDGTSATTYVHTVKDGKVDENAKGTRHAPEGLSEVNEQGWELIRDAKTGRLRIAGGGKRTITHLNEGDIVYTHAESKRMVADDNDIIVPQHKTGKKQKKYNKARQTILDNFEKKLEEKKHLQKMYHWTDAQFQKVYKKLYNTFSAKLKKENKNWKGVKTSGLGRDIVYPYKESGEDVNHERATNAIEKALDTLSKKEINKKNINKAKAVIKKHRKHISAEEATEYNNRIKELQAEDKSDKTKESIEAKFTNLDYGGSQKKLKTAINNAYRKGKITAQEKADYLKRIDEYNREGTVSKSKENIESAIASLEYGAKAKDVKAIINKAYKNKEITKQEKADYLKQVSDYTTGKASDKAKDKIESAFTALDYGGKIKDVKKAINEAYKNKQITSQEKADYLSRIKDYQAGQKSDKAKSSINTAIEGIGTTTNLAAVEKQINEAAKNKLITTSEKDDLLKQAREKDKEVRRNKAERELSNMMTGLESGGNLDKVNAKINQMAKEGLITAEEKEDYLKDAKERAQQYKHDQATKNIENYMSSVRGTNEDFAQAKKKIQEAVKSGAISAEEQEEYLKQAYKQNADYNMKMFQNGKVTYTNMKKMIEQYYKEGKLTAAEYYEYIEQLAQEQFEKEKERIEKQKQANDDKYSLAKAYVNRQIELLEKEDKEKEKTEEKQERENKLQEEQNKLIEAQNNLMKAKSQLVKVYREGRGFVYEEDAEAIKEATDALKEQQKAVADVQKEINEVKKEEVKNEQLEKWQTILDMFDEAETLANIKELENKVGGTAAGLFGGMGTDINKWTAYIKNSLATSLGLSSVIDAMSEITDYTDMLAYLQGNGTVAQSKITAAINKNRFASGTLNSPAGLARVAEQGYEIALLGKGDAVMPHNVSRNLMDWGAYSPHDFAKVMSGEGKQVSYNFDKLVLPNVANANDFIRELNKLPNKALQFGTSRV